MLTISIPFSKINLAKVTRPGLDLLMDIALRSEDFEKAALIRDEINKRLLSEHHNTK